MKRKIFSFRWLVGRIIYSSSILTIIWHLFHTRPKTLINVRNFFSKDEDILERLYRRYVTKRRQDSVSLDLGCGLHPVNPFNAESVVGIDVYEDKENVIYKCNLGFDVIPFDDNTFDYVTAFDLVEHIPRFWSDEGEIKTPVIFLMNEVWRVLRADGLFLSSTPIYPFVASFQDPTHNNIMTYETYRQYFSTEKYDIAKQYGISTNFEILEEKLYGEALISILRK